MKIVGLIIILILTAQQSFAMDIFFGNVKCSGTTFTKLDNGNFAFEKIKATFTPTTSQKVYFSKKYNDSLRFEFEKVNTQSLVSTMVYDHEEMLVYRGYTNNSLNLNRQDFKFDKATMFKFRDKAVVGLNLVCAI